jgi:hypothetical protein
VERSICGLLRERDHRHVAYSAGRFEPVRRPLGASPGWGSGLDPRGLAPVYARHRVSRWQLASQRPGLDGVVATPVASLAPPNAPWRPIRTASGAGSYVSVYLSSPVARLPVRDVLKIDDNKSDPNLETLTYGLFSTCEPTMRQSIASRGISEIFFVTSVEELGRALVGMYELGWVVEVGARDFAYAARQAHFVDPIPVAQITGRAGRELGKPLRNYRIIDSEVADEVRELVTTRGDRTGDYLFEIDRLERMSLSRTGFRYPSWDRPEPFSWDDAAPYLAEAAGAIDAPNISTTGVWRCTKCGAHIRNEARLKVCNVCKGLGTLEPAEVAE